MHDAIRLENICSTSKYSHTRFHIILYKRLALLCLQIHFWVCARMHDYENQHARCKQIRKHSQYFKVLSYKISYHSVKQICSIMLANSFWGSAHVCTTMKISMHDASSSQNICSTSKCDHTKFHIIPSSRLATLCLQMHFGGLCTYA